VVRAVSARRRLQQLIEGGLKLRQESIIGFEMQAQVVPTVLQGGKSSACADLLPPE
jgi:hypothetical protein